MDKKLALRLVNKKNIFYILLLFFVISIIPILALAGYNYPCADDFSASDTAYHAWLHTGSIFQVLKAAIENVVYNYKEWSGVFASVFWTSLQPGIFGEQYYGVTTWITIVLLSISCSYFFHVILHSYLEADFYETGIITLLFLFSIIQCMPSGLEGLYWHAGVVNYTWAYGFLLLLTALQLSLYKERIIRKRVLKCILGVIMAVLVGGGNFITALQGVLWSGTIFSLLLLSSVIEKKEPLFSSIKKLIAVFLPLFVLLISFGISVLAPGNKVRMGMSTGMNPIKAVLLSFYYALEEPIETWLSWPIIILWLLALPIVIEIVRKKGYKFRYPIVAVGIGVSFLAAGFTPSLYAQGAMEAGRLHNTVFFIWILLLYLVTIYLIGWLFAGKRIGEWEKNQREKSIYMTSLLLFFVLFSLLTSAIDEDTYVAANATQTLVSGEAKQYKIENETRIRLVSESQEEEVVVPGLTVFPELLLFQEISRDPKEWINTVVADYYGKKSVRTE